ncbi:helix-turn-helix domain-containing protein [Peptoniphilus sp. SGI.035]|uniref:helix-turn-helix domain-containing protein n=1 Tax=Peptoniphilus sp. SGI.035 TaxID=3420564 RepID=UPI003D07EAF2
MNERVKELRKALGLSGEKFGENIGLNRAAISKIENGAVGVSESNVKLICLTYNVNEDWLRTGEGSMFNETPQDYLKELQRRHNLTDFQLELVKTYLELSEANKSAIDDFIASCAKNTKDKEI